MSAERFIERMVMLFGVPDTHDEEAFYNEVRAMLGNVEPAILTAAGDIIRNTQKRRGWPTFGEIMGAVEKASVERRTVEPRTEQQQTGRLSAQAGVRFVKGPLGEQAADEGWLLSLHDFCREHHRLPNLREIHDLKASAKEFHRMVADVQARKDAVGAALSRLGRSMMAREQQLGEIIDGTRDVLTPIDPRWPA